MVGDITHLLEVWVAGWAGCRGYETRTEGRFPAALRADTTGDWEYFASDPTDAEFADLRVVRTKTVKGKAEPYDDQTYRLVKGKYATAK